MGRTPADRRAGRRRGRPPGRREGDGEQVVLRPCRRTPACGGPCIPSSGKTSRMPSTCAQPNADRSTRTRPDTVGSGEPSVRQAAHVAVITFGVRSTARRPLIRSPASDLATDRYPDTVEGRQSWSAANHSPSNRPMVMPGRDLPVDRTNSAFAAHRARAASATARLPRTVIDRYRDRPLTTSGPNATRTSQTPARRSRTEPLPRVFLIRQA